MTLAQNECHVPCKPDYAKHEAKVLSSSYPPIPRGLDFAENFQFSARSVAYVEINLGTNFILLLTTSSEHHKLRLCSRQIIQIVATDETPVH